MARIRSIHPSLFTDDDFVELSSDAKVLLIGIWTECDDFGLFEWKPKRLKMRIFPADNIEIDSVISELVGNGFVTSYELEGNKYGAIKNFCKWQKPKKPNNFCPFNKEIGKFVRYEFRTGGELVGNWWVKSVSEGKKGRREEGRKEGKKEGILEGKIEEEKKDDFEYIPKTMISQSFMPCQDALADIRKKNLDENEVLKAFVNHYMGSREKYADWQAKFRSWVANARPNNQKQQQKRSRRQMP